MFYGNDLFFGFLISELGKKSKQEHTYGMHSSDEDYRKKPLIDESDDEDVLYEKNKYSSTVRKQKSDLNNNNFA